VIKNESLQIKLKRTLREMREAGFPIEGQIKIVIDEKLPFMGYTTYRSSEHLVVVSGMAVKSGLIEGLLIHELSHVYRTETNHPSHNHALLNQVAKQIQARYKLSAKYQTKIFQGVVNHIQDLYADDITFQVFQKFSAQLGTPNQLSDFFLSWIKTKPTQLKNKKEEKWINLSIMLNNSFAISNISRHHIEDVGGRAKNANEIFLAKLDHRLSARFPYFRRFMTNLEENISENEFRTQLLKYINTFLELAL
jgi:hypothetical protein